MPRAAPLSSRVDPTREQVEQRIVRGLELVSCASTNATGFIVGYTPLGPRPMQKNTVDWPSLPYQRDPGDGHGRGDPTPASTPQDSNT